MARVQEKARAIALRRKGYTYGEIQKVIPNLSKGTLSGWCNSIQLTPSELERVRKRMQVGIDRARFQAMLTNRKNREVRDEQICIVAQKEFERYKHEPFFTFGLALYWAEGTKKGRRFQFTNSDPRLAISMIEWMAKDLQIGKDRIKVRLYLHKLYEHENCEGFWARLINIPQKSFLKTVYKSTLHTVKKNPNYKGCLRMDAGTVASWVKTIEWQNCFQKSMRL